ncbi:MULTISPECIES: glutathione S-transferase family protein [Pseudoalteromonas]|uniref:Glutathione S-transferase n=1 Tax=Pseudoalteromonas amylolytica TaxID=1859457 RepID=A0A1S1MX78_9GAMM|nr:MULTISPECIES: glutathione S-transferase family protein [Pseudoalteromonas]OHU89060.1 glutathione S-transferase [Pseudoalteromonas sp. JW3]OHU91960.1 glutathione S-transferase [Pseudoalteromonas amylolytica]
MQLYGSNTSPYARRIRMFCARHNLNVDYLHLDIFSDQGKAVLVANNPARKIPFLVDGEHTICDSGAVYRYLTEKFNLSKMTYWQENQLTNINACNDSLVELLLCERSGFDTQSDTLFFNLQRERIAAVLTDLNEQCVKTDFLDCDYLQISLYCLLDWIIFRSLAELAPYNALLDFYEVHKSLPGSTHSDPRI